MAEQKKSEMQTNITQLRQACDELETEAARQDQEIIDVFKKEEENPSIRTITVVINWVEDVDQPVNSLSYVLTEKQKNAWHNVGGSDQCIVMCPSAEPQGGGGGW